MSCTSIRKNNRDKQPLAPKENSGSPNIYGMWEEARKPGEPGELVKKNLNTGRACRLHTKRPRLNPTNTPAFRIYDRYLKKEARSMKYFAAHQKGTILIV